MKIDGEIHIEKKYDCRKISIGRMLLNNSRDEEPIFHQLFRIIVRDREEFGKWLWYLRDENALDITALRDMQMDRRYTEGSPEQKAAKREKWLLANLPIESPQGLKRYMQGKVRDRSRRQFFVVFRQMGEGRGEIVGCLSFGGTGKTREMHWWLDRKHRGNGIMKEAHELAQRYLYAEGVRTLVASVDIDNFTGRKAIEKVYPAASSRLVTAEIPLVWRNAFGEKHCPPSSSSYEYEMKLVKSERIETFPKAKDVYRDLYCIVGLKGQCLVSEDLHSRSSIAAQQH